MTAVTLGIGQEVAVGESDPDSEGRDSAPAGVVYDGSAGQLEVPGPQVGEADIDIDGEIDEAAWLDAPVLTGFTQYDPVEGVPATQRTEARVLVTGDAIYFAVTAWDDVEGGVRATLGDRDSFARSDDYVRFIIDTFNDHRRGYVIMVNPLGVQQDGLWVVGGGGERQRRFGPPIDWNPDFVWESSGRLFDGGYTVEVKLPFKSIRFRKAPVQDWGLQIDRRIARNGYGESWAPVTANVANQMEQFGTLTGLRDISPGLFLEVNPVQTFSKQGAYDHGAGAFQREGVDGDFGMNVTYGITSNLTLDATYNPDFSQVEADAGQIRVNERFALFLREKRPFFLEGTEIFQLPRQLVYTRSIVNPVVGAKLQGKIGSFNAGYLGALDEVAAPDSPEGRENAVVNLFRLRRDLGSTSNVGMVYTDRTFARDRFNRVLGVDGRFQFNQRYTITLLAAGSRTADGDAESVGDGLFSARVERSGRNFQFQVAGHDIGNDFEAGSGFLRRTGVAQLESRVSYNFRGRPGDFIERWGPSLEANGVWTHDDFRAGRRAQEARVQLGGSVSFRGNITVFGNFSRSQFRFGRDSYYNLASRGAGGARRAFLPDQSLFDGLNSGTVFFWVSSFDRVRGNLRLTWSESPLFDFISDAPVDVADSWSADASLNLFPTTNLSAEVGARHTSLFRKRDGSLYSRATIPRARAQYQFSRALYLRAIVEYGSQRRGALLTPTGGDQVVYCSNGTCFDLAGSESNDFSFETLLSYEPTPGTVFFMGYTRRMEDMEAFRFRDLRPEAEGLFVKLSYRFRG